MKKFVLAPALAALAMFVLGTIFWMSPLPYMTLSSTANDDAASTALGKIFPTTGFYLVPGPHGEPKEIEAIYARGPIAFVHFVKEGFPMMEPSTFVKGYIHYFVIAVLLMIMLTKANALFDTFMCRVKFSTFIGVLGAVAICFSDPIWWHHTWGWHAMGALYTVLEFATAGAVLAKFSMPSASAK